MDILLLSLIPKITEGDGVGFFRKIEQILSKLVNFMEIFGPKGSFSIMSMGSFFITVCSAVLVALVSSLEFSFTKQISIEEGILKGRGLLSLSAFGRLCFLAIASF